MSWLPWSRSRQAGTGFPVSAGSHGVAAGGSVVGSALGEGSQVIFVGTQHFTAAAAEVTWPVVVGQIPVLASAFQPRAGLRRVIGAAPGGSRSLVMASGDATLVSSAGAPPSGYVMSGSGGVGKSQLAAAYAREALRDGTDLVMWAPASDVQQLLSAYAQAALLVQAPGYAGSDPEGNARAFLGWLAATERSWLVVLDDVTDPDVVSAWCPGSARGTGWILATTRLKDPRLTGGGRARIDVDVYTPDEADAFLHARLTGEAMDDLIDNHATALAEALGHLPLALGHAAAYIIREQTTCQDYLNQFSDRAASLDELLPHWADTERYGRQITATLLLALDATDRDPLGALAREALRITALLDPDGHPAALWNTPALTAHLTRAGTRPQDLNSTAPPPVTGDQARAALRLLDRYGLITHSPRADGHRAVRIHALTARAVRETSTGTDHATSALAAADALAQIWPNNDHTQREFAAVLRANSETLSTFAREALWTPSGYHAVLDRTGESLYKARLHSAGSTFWHTMTADCERILGSDHPATLTARANLADFYREAGRVGEAITIEEQVLADRERVLGDDHPDTLSSRENLAVSYGTAGKVEEVVDLLEQVVADRERILGSDHPDTLLARVNLAISYESSGQRLEEAFAIKEQVLADRERILGRDHPDTLTSRLTLAVSHCLADRTDLAIEIGEQALADSERILGSDHPDTLIISLHVASFYGLADRAGEAVDVLEQVVADHERLLGSNHVDTLTIRASLAASYGATDRTSEAVDLSEQVLADRERILGSAHPDTLTNRHQLALFYWAEGRRDEAINLLEHLMADQGRILGSNHRNTRDTRDTLTDCYQQQGRTEDAHSLLERALADEAIAAEQQVLADRERTLGHDHPDTLRARLSLARSYYRAQRHRESIEQQERVVAGQERLDGPDHPVTILTRGNLAYTLWIARHTQQAINLLERVLADQKRVLGTEHPDTLTSSRDLDHWRSASDEADQSP